MSDYRLLRQLSIAVVIAMLLTGCNTPSEPPSRTPEQQLEIDREAIAQLYSRWKIAVENGDRAGYVKVLDEQVSMIAPGAADIVGRDAYAAFLVPVLKHAEYRIEPLGEIQIDLLGDYALVRYDYVVHVSMTDGMSTISDNQAALDQVVNRSKYLDIVKRQDSGEWKVYRHMWNEGPQAPPEA